MRRWLQILAGARGSEKTHTSGSRQRRFSMAARLKLILLAVVMAGFWILAGSSGMKPGEQAIWEKVRGAQLQISRWRRDNGTASPETDDPWQCGLIGVEWSGITTTLGDLTSKRTACDPAWAIQFKRWLIELGLEAGDPVAIYSSSSFPGLLLSALSAVEAMQLEPLVIVSLGASTWGANHPESPWPLLAAELRRGGFIRHRADYYTLGGEAESGLDLAPEAVSLLKDAADSSGVELLTTGSLAEMISLKSALLDRHQARALISIGGSHANLGDAPEVLRLGTGLVLPMEAGAAGNGVIGEALRVGIPVIHMLNIRALSARSGIPYDREPRKMAPLRVSAWWSVVGLIVFFAVILRHRRWRLEPER